MCWPDIHKVFNQLVYNPSEPLIFSTGLFLWLFLFFISGFYLVHKRHNLKIAYVILFSLFFYYRSSGIYFLLLVTSTIVDYTLANFIYKANSDAKKKAWLVFSLVLNLGLLGYFKYTNFLLEIFHTAFNKPFNPLEIFLPVGVSFFTFQSLSYTIDIYRNEIKPVNKITDYAFFVSFFPQLVAGPIVRARDFLPQINKQVFVSREMFGRAVFLIASGLFKKAIISDYISINFVDRIFDNPTLYTGLENLFGVYGYALQIYCDFSGYSDMAIGIALLFGYELCLNFNSPYQSSSITEFWRRWHISLSTWLRDYLYISLGGNRYGRLRTYINQFLTMLLGGLWHGAAFKFILWGMMHGVALGIDKLVKEFVRFPDYKWIKFLGIVLTFHFVCFCWIFFRADDMNNAMAVLSQIAFHFTPSVFIKFITGYKNILWVMALGYFLHFVPQSVDQRARDFVTDLPLFYKVILTVAIIVLVVQFKSSAIQPFIYFQF
ncbi:MAG: MBOAT family protein [Chitinophagales bacterium]|nr:MBOAT family protein [Chitinophagales bacterium]